MFDVGTYHTTDAQAWGTTKRVARPFLAYGANARSLAVAPSPVLYSTMEVTAKFGLGKPAGVLHHMSYQHDLEEGSSQQRSQFSNAMDYLSRVITKSVFLKFGLTRLN